MVAVRADVQVACDHADVPSTESIQDWVAAAVAGAGTHEAASVEVAVRVVGAGEMQALNSRYRKQDKATNVLSFEAGNLRGLPDNAPQVLGDVVVCAPVVAAEAAAQGKPLQDHWGHMLVHGTLHLLGFDHQSEAEAAEMEALETRILAGREVADPYASRD